MKEETLMDITASLQEKYPDVGIRKIEMHEDGTSSYYLDPTKKTLAFLDKGRAAVPRIFRGKETAATITRDAIDRSSLDLAQKDPYEETAQNLFKRADRYYYTDPVVGTVVNLLANLAAKGFEHDIDDANIKQFYDAWAFDVNLVEVLEWIFLEFFKTGHVITYKVLAAYEPRVSYLSPIPGKKLSKPTKKSKATGKMLQEAAQHEIEILLQAFREEARRLGKKDAEIQELEIAAKKNIWSKGHLPVAYTVLNPQLINVTGNLLFDKTAVSMTLPPELTVMLKKPTSEMTEDEKALVKALPSELKAAAEKGGEYKLDSRLVGSITYRKQPYERYAKPRSTRVFDSLEYKKALKQADLSTLDGISNYILKITIGSDEFPVTTQTELEAVAQLFNTPSKSFDVVWNHTLNIEKIVSPEIEAILGQDKYTQVNEDISGGLAVSRALIDGISDLNVAEAGLVIKGLMEELNYARSQITRWIYREYQQIAEAVGFDSFPKIRWDEAVLQDVILYMNTLSQLVDRRMVSYRTALEGLGFDFPNEKKNMEEEFPIVQDGTFGIIGSPWQQAKAGPGGGSNVQPVQKAPTGTPSQGRPKGQPAGKKTPNPVPTAKTPKPKKATSSITIADMVTEMSKEEFLDFKHELEKLRLKE